MNAKALLSVSDKTGLETIARFLVAQGLEILSTGGTAKFLAEKGIPYTQVSDYTGFPEMLDGRVKTLQPKIHGGILARRGISTHDEACRAHEIAPIDWVIVNLYPFAETIRKPTSTFEDAIENIDIGGPTLLRSAAKNFEHVAVCVDPRDYDKLIAEYEQSGSLSYESRLGLAQKVFAHTAAYDALIQEYLYRAEGRSKVVEIEDGLDQEILVLSKRQALRYGENPHQKAALFSVRSAASAATDWTQLQGKELSYNNLIDLTAAWELVQEFKGQTACAIIKHTNPCGVGIDADRLLSAFERAKACDPVSAFGGIVAVSRPLDGATAAALSDLFLEVIVAPEFSVDARQVLAAKKNLRLVQITAGQEALPFEYRRVLGGILLQEPDRLLAPIHAWKWVTARPPTDAEKSALDLAWKTVKHVKSNAIVIASAEETLGIGAGQMSRVDSVRIAGEKARTDLRGAVLASDAFFPFRDNIDEAAKLGIAAIVQPGGSVRDDEVIAACNDHGIAMAMTGERHFKH